MTETKNNIRKIVFESVVPIRVDLADAPVPFCFNVPRQVLLGYFILNKLSAFLPDDKSTVWFSHNAKPVKWTLPVGVIYDALAGTKESFNPLRIEVQTKDFPEDIVMRCESVETVEYFFCHAIKESIFLTDNKLDLIQNNTGFHKNVVAAVIENDFSKYHSLLNIRIPDSIQRWNKWPIKLVKDDLTVIQCFVIVEPNHTIGNVLQTKNIENEKLIVQGIEVNKSMLLADVVPLLISADGFFYIALH